MRDTECGAKLANWNEVWKPLQEFLVKDVGSIDGKGMLIRLCLSHSFWIYIAHELFLYQCL